jgi:hypothetical protein
MVIPLFSDDKEQYQNFIISSFKTAGARKANNDTFCDMDGKKGVHATVLQGVRW